MINFFRKIRQQLLTQNKVSKYLLYAIGEIVLVVIGILIALTVNNNNEQRKTEEKIATIFEEILDEISFDIRKINNATAFYQQKDSLTYLVLNGKLTDENYKNNTPARLFDLTIAIRIIHLTSNAYSNLLPLSNDAPAKYTEILKELRQLYDINKKRVDFIDSHIYELAIENSKNQIYNYPWATLQIPNNQNKKYIEYLLHDNNYKAIVLFQYELNLMEHLRLALYYKIRAISCYRQIAKILNKPIDNTLFGIEPEVANSLVGRWNSDKVPENNFSLNIGDHGILTRTDKDLFSDLNYFMGKNKIVSMTGTGDGPLFYTIIKDKDELFLFENNGTVWNKIKE